MTEVDGGEVIEQSDVPISPDDTPETLATKVLKEELSLYPKALKTAINSLNL